MMKNSMIMSGTSASALGIAMTAAERAAGRLMRAPDHDAGTDGGAGGSTDGGQGDGNGNAGGEGQAGSVPGSDGAGAGADGGGAGEGSQASEGGDGGDNGGAASDGNADGDGTILGDAAKADGNADGAEGEGEGGSDEGGRADEGPRLTFGEGEDAADILGAPEAYEVSAPEGMEFDKAAFDAIEPVLRELNLSNDAAQAVVNAYAEKIIPMFEDRVRADGEAVGADMRRDWAAQSEQQFDGKEGRPTLKEAKALARQTFLKFGIGEIEGADGKKETHPFLQLLDDSGIGNHPAMLSVMSMMGRALGEAAVDPSKGGSQPERLADRVYGKPIPRST